jgi:hypothetical protein
VGVEVGNYSAGFESYNCQAKNNLVIFTGTGASNGVGLDFSERCYNSQADGNIVQGGKYAGRMQGSVTNCQFGFTLASGQATSGLIVQSDGTNAPSGCDLGNLRIEAPSASYGFNIQGGTNISTGRAHGTVASSLINRATGVTGDNALGLDNGLAFQSGTGSPEAVLTGPIGSVYLRTDGGATTTLYVKTSGSGATGWTSK